MLSRCQADNSSGCEKSSAIADPCCKTSYAGVGPVCWSQHPAHRPVQHPVQGVPVVHLGKVSDSAGHNAITSVPTKIASKAGSTERAT